MDIQKEVWLTAVLGNEAVDNALILAQSLREYCTKCPIAAVFVHDVSSDERRKLRKIFDVVLLFDDTFLENVEMSLESKVKLFALSQSIFKKGCFIASNYKVKSNVDQIFEENAIWDPLNKGFLRKTMESPLFAFSTALQSQEVLETFLQDIWEEANPDKTIESSIPIDTVDVPEEFKLHFSGPDLNENIDKKCFIQQRSYGLLGAQEYVEIKDKCLRDGVLFEDSCFSGDDISWCHTESISEGLELKRPHEISEEPQFLVSGASRFDVNQGYISNCWFIAAVARLTMDENLFNAVVPEDNTFEKEKYSGAFHFRFWHNGKWVDVVIDDRLPTHDGNLVYMSSKDSNEFWPALLEKAYAKLHGNYKHLAYGWAVESFTNLTGGITEFYETKDSPSSLFKIMEKANQRSSFMCCSTPTFDGDEQQATGLFGNHAYTITKILRIPDADARLVRIRNPHGEGEWQGAWNETSDEWNSVSEELKQDLGLTVDNNGEFWMSFEDFLVRFAGLEICHWNVNELSGPDEAQKQWQCYIFEEKWIRGATAGGYPMILDENEFPRESFACNPQYVITLVDPDTEDDQQQCTLIVALLQKNTREQGKDNVSIGFQVYALSDSDPQSKPLPGSFFASKEPVAKGPEFQSIRQVCKRFTLDPGTYVIVPCTLEPNVEGEFILRVYTEAQVNIKEHDGKLSITDVETRIDNETSEIVNQIGLLFKVLCDNGEEIDGNGLKKILDTTLQEDYFHTDDVCRSLMALVDAEIRGKIKLEDVVYLHKCMVTWKKTFKLYDHDSSGNLDGLELREVLASMGIGVNKKTLQIIVLRYGDVNGNLSFENFIKCAIKLKAIAEIISESFGEIKSDSKMYKWCHLTLYI